MRAHTNNKMCVEAGDTVLPSASAVSPDGKRTYPFQLPTTLTASPGLVHRKSTCGWRGLRTCELLELVWAVEAGP
jgi:hypothetical protein